ncbi:MAG: TolC family protein [bacterium]
MRKILFSAAYILLILALASSALTLKESTEIALRHNFSVKAAQNKLTAAEAKLNQAVGAFFPTVKIDGSYSNAYTQPSIMQFTIGGVTNDFIVGTSEINTNKALSASFNQPLFVAGLFPGYAMMRKAKDIASEDLRRTIQETEYNVTAAYFQLLAADRYVKLQDESLKSARSHLAQVETMQRNGVVAKTDYLRAEVQVTNYEVSLTKAKNMLELAKNSFNIILARPMETEVSLVEDVNAVLPKTVDFNALLDQAYAYRPDWRQFDLTKKTAEDDVTLAKTGYLPTVFLTGSTGYRGQSYTGFNSDVNSWNVTGVASWTLFDGLMTHNKIKEASANLAAQTATEEQIKLNIALEVREAFLDLQTAGETIGSAQKAVGFADESLKASSVRYYSGAGTNIEVIDAQVALTQAKINYLQTLFDLVVAKAKINKVVGKEVFTL